MRGIIVTLVIITSLFSNEDSQDFLEGKKIYEQTCISCHGVDGQTNPLMQLIVKPRRLNKTILTAKQSFQIIKEGAKHWGARADIMPAFKYVYNDRQISAVVTYITKKFNPNRDKKIKKLLDESQKLSIKQKVEMLKIGKKIFIRNCSLCHGVTGNGESAFVEQSKTNNQFIYPYNLQKTLLSEDDIFLYAKFGGHFWGTSKDDMPSWKKKYNDVKLKSVARYVQKIIKKEHKHTH